MRRDLAKVIVEKPRHYSRLPALKKGYMKSLQKNFIDELTQREPVLGRWKGRTKKLNKHSSRGSSGACVPIRWITPIVWRMPSIDFRKSVLPGLGLSQGKIGVLLTGDLYTVPELDMLGGSGDVTAVCEAFGLHFAWVVGVTGNHDSFGKDQSKPPRFQRPLYFLDQQALKIEGITIAGMSGIVGESKKPWRKPEEEFEIS